MPAVVRTILSLRLSLTMLVAGCTGAHSLSPVDSAPLPEEADADTDADIDTGTDPVCEARVATLSPGAGATAVWVDAAITATFTLPVTAATITVEPPVAGTLTLAGDGRGATFVPTEPLARGTTYAATATTCDTSLTGAFTTVGQPVAVDLTLRTWDVDLADRSDLVWVAPGFGATLAAQLDTPHLLLMAESATTGTIQFVLAAGVEEAGVITQYGCAIAVDVPSGDFSGDPGFEAGPVYTVIALDGVTLPVWDLEVAGEVASDGSGLLNLVVSGAIDLAPLTPLFGQDP